MNRKPDAPFSNRQILLGIGLILLVLLFTGNLLARRLTIFSADNMTFQAEANLVLSEDSEDSIVVVADSVSLESDVDRYAFLMANSVDVSGAVGQNLTAIGETITFSGEVEGDALIMGETVRLEGNISGEALVLATDLVVVSEDIMTLTACTETIDISAEIEVLPCDGDTAMRMFQQGWQQVASIGFVSLMANPGVLRGVVGILPLPLMLTVTALAALTIVVLPGPVNKMSVAVRLHPGRMAATGGMVTLMLVGLTALQLVVVAYAPIAGLIVLPLYAVGLVAYGVLLLAGWVTVMLAFGGWLIRRVSNTMIPSVLLVSVGGLVLSFVALALHWLPGGEWVNSLLFVGLGLAGLGASYTTRFGRRAIAFGFR